MKLGGPVFGDISTPEKWIADLTRRNYRSAAFPLSYKSEAASIKAYAAAANQANIVIAEVGAWSNPISTNEVQRREAMQLCAAQLELADHVGALCCVNIAGSRGEQWDGPHPDNLSGDTFDLIVETVRAIIDAARPARTFYTLETMPWIFPDSPESYLRLIHAIDRRQFAVHLDPVNMINCPERYFNNSQFLRRCFEQLGPYIKSCHAKDILLSNSLTVHLSEVRPGEGALDYATYLRELNRLSPDIPLLLEHMPTEEDYDFAGQYIRSAARSQGLPDA